MLLQLIVVIHGGLSDYNGCHGSEKAICFFRYARRLGRISLLFACLRGVAMEFAIKDAQAAIRGRAGPLRAATTALAMMAMQL
jgi:hypothetical protein